MLVTLQQIQSYKSLTRNLDEAKQMLPYIQEAQEFDLRPFLGEELYNALVDDYNEGLSPCLATDIYSDLYNGSTYTYGGHTYTNPGIVPVLCYFAYARYVEASGLHSTPTGFVQKNTEWSSAASEKTLSRVSHQARSGAIEFQERVRKFLSLNSTDYPLWYGGKRRRKGSFRITAVGGNSNRRRRCDDTCNISTSSSSSDCGDDYVDSDFVD